MHRQIIALLLLFLASSCGTGISVQNQYFSREDLASFKVGTPDPMRNCPPIGQRLIVQWKYPQEMMAYEDFKLVMTVRLRDYTEEQIIIPINRFRGTYIYELVNQRYFDSCGIATYKIETWACGRLIKVWRHQLWTELITIDRENDANAFPESTDEIDFSSDEIDFS